MARNGVETHIITGCRLRKPRQEGTDEKVILHEVPFLNIRLLRTDLLTYGVQSARRFGDLHRSLVFDIVEGPNIDPIGFFLSQDDRSRYPPIVISVHSVLKAWRRDPVIKAWRADIPTFYRKYTRWFSAASRQVADKISLRMEERVFTRCDHLVTCSIHVKNELKEFYSISDGDISVVHPGVDTSLFTPVVKGETMEKENQRPFTILFVGGLGARKGVHYLLESVPLMVREEKNLHLILVGSGHLGDAFKERVRQMGFDRKVTFLGSLPHFELPRLYNDADLVVLPSLHESAGKVLLESMSCEKPIVATNVGGIPELILDGETGLLVPPQDPDAIAQAVLRLLLNSDLRRRMGLKGRERVQKLFTWKIHAEKLQKIYEKISKS